MPKMENMEIKCKKILVTGGAGFIGGHLVEKLIALGAKVFVIDIIIDPKSYFTQNQLEKKCKFSFVDIRNKKKVEDFFSKNNINYIFHLAAEAIVEEAFTNPYDTFETNIMGTINILEAVRESKSIKGLIAASSDKAYGKTQKAYTEESPLRGDHPYDVSKSAMDLICQSYFKTYKLPVVITRFGNVYGEGDLHFDRIIPGICKAVINNETLKIRSDGTYVRDYIYVKDVVDGYIELLKNIDKVFGEVYNFSSSDNLSVVNLIKVAEKSLGKKVKYNILNNAKNEIPYQHLDDSKIRKLGWENNYSFTSTLPKIIEWYNNIN